MKLRVESCFRKRKTFQNVWPLDDVNGISFLFYFQILQNQLPAAVSVLNQQKLRLAIIVFIK